MDDQSNNKLALLSRFELALTAEIVTWLILPVVICLSQRLSHACLSINKFILLNCEWLIKSVIVYLMVPCYSDTRKELLRKIGRRKPTLVAHCCDTVKLPGNPDNGARTAGPEKFGAAPMVKALGCGNTLVLRDNGQPSSKGFLAYECSSQTKWQWVSIWALKI